MTDEELAAYAPKPLPPSMDYLRDLIKRHRQGCPQEIALDLLAEVERLRGWRDIAEEHLSNQLALERENAALRAGLTSAVAAYEDVQEYVVAHAFDTTVGRKIDDYITERLNAQHALLASES